jgi:hypothetical protein
MKTMVVGQTISGLGGSQIIEDEGDIIEKELQ